MAAAMMQHVIAAAFCATVIASGVKRVRSLVFIAVFIAFLVIVGIQKTFVAPTD
jgi:hypothetical protein